MIINVKEFLGEDFLPEDAIVLRSHIEQNLNDENIELDFNGIDRVSTYFLQYLFADLIYRQGRDYIIDKINVKNLSNHRDYSRVVKGTTFN